MPERAVDFFSRKWLKRFVAGARFEALASKDPSTKVGCVIVDDDKRKVATGFNGFAHGVKDTSLRLEDRGVKHLFTVHAEANAVAQAAKHGVSLRNTTAFVTHPPCAQCASLLVQAGVKAVFWCGELAPSWAESSAVATVVFNEAGVVSGNIERLVSGDDSAVD